MSGVSVNFVTPPDQASPIAIDTPVSPKLPTQAYNCLVCKNRKVKCDRQVPCSTCTKLNVDCQYVEPGPRKKRKTSSKHENILQRLNKYEELLKQLETNVMHLPEGEAPPPPPPPSHGKKREINDSAEPHDKSSERVIAAKKVKRDRTQAEHEIELCMAKKGGLLSSTGRSRYYENNLWNSLNDELQEMKETILDSSDDDKADDWSLHNFTPSSSLGTGILFFGPVNAKADVSGFHPSAAHCVILWNHFLDNVNPLTHIIHYPSLASQVMEYKDKPQTMPRNLEALMFSIYALTICSMDNKQCQSLFDDPKPTLLARYRFAAQHALKNAGTLKTTDIVVLQGFIFFLLDLRSYYDYPSLWVITGTAVRIAQRMGIHRDGTKLNLPPFETEMRRRLWREILILDFRTAELSGAGLYTMAIDENAWDSRWPLSVNEADIWPGMTHTPEERIGPTDNMWCQLRSELGNLFVERWRRMNRTSVATRFYDENPDDGTKFANFYKALDNDEQLADISKKLEERYIRYCDPVNPLHLFTSIVCRAALTNLRLMTHHPIRRPDGGAGMSQEEKDSLFSDSIKVVEYDNLCHSSRSLQKYLWHVKSFFQWHAFIYLLGELRHRSHGPEVEKAWAQVDEVFEHHHEWLERKDELHAAIRAFALKAWECREGLLAKVPGKLQQVKIPMFVQALRTMYFNAGATTAASQNRDQIEQGLLTVAVPSNIQQQYQLNSKRDGLDNGVNIIPPESSPPPSCGCTGGTAGESQPTDSEARAMSPPTATADNASSTNGVTPINWSEWEILLQNSDLLGFSGAFKCSYDFPYGSGG
ncbi:hypothetical protein ABW20_dc0107955 [Dactylellina cionopaga]|nr:hypothetical protein ABW20_dc0107955 [Dactylellina cionopaga]